MNFISKIVWMIGIFTIGCALLGAVTPGMNFVFCFGKSEICTLKAQNELL